jgi:hypothetical protein
MRTSESIKSIAAALFQFQMKLVQPHKDETADTGKFKYQYVSLPALKDHIKPLMEECGLVFFSCGLTSRVVHVDSGEWIEGDFVCDVAGLDAQKCGAVGSYARRYNLSGLLDICAEEDDDAASALPHGSSQVRKATPQRQQAQPQAAAHDSEGSPTHGDDNGDVRRFTGKIAFIKEKSGTGKNGPWKKYSIKAVSETEGDRWFSTFDTTLGKIANETKGTSQVLEYIETQWNGMPQFDLQGFVR